MLGLGLLLYFSAWPLIWNLVIRPNADSRPGMRASLFKSHSADKPASSFIVQQASLAPSLPNSRIEAVAIWQVPFGGERLLSLECDDYGSLLIDNRPIMAQRPGTRDRNVSQAVVDLDRGPHLICLVLYNTVGKGWLKLSIGEGPRATPVGGGQLRLVDLGNLRNWLKAERLAGNTGRFLIGASLLLLFAQYLLISWRQFAPASGKSMAEASFASGSVWLPWASFLAAAALAVYGSIITSMPYQPYYSTAASLVSWGLVLVAGIWALGAGTPIYRRQAMVAALTMVAATAWRYSDLIGAGWLHGILDGDLIYYHSQSLSIFGGQGGLRDYPLLANLFVGLPAIFEQEHYRTYVQPLSVISGALGLMGALLILKMAHDKRTASIMVLFYVLTPFNANWMLNRLDAAMVLLVLLSVYFFKQGKPFVTTLLVAAGFWFKGAPIVLYPFFITAWIIEYGWSKALRSLALLSALLALPFLIFDNGLILEPFRFQEHRKVTCASIFYIFHHLLNPSDVQGSPYNPIVDVAPWFNQLSKAALPAALTAFFAYFAWGSYKRRGRYCSKRLVMIFSLLSLELFIMANKIYSPQFILWTFAAAITAWCLAGSFRKAPGWLILALLTLISAANMLPYYGGFFLCHYFILSLIFWMASALLFFLLLPRVTSGPDELSSSRIKGALMQVLGAALLLGVSLVPAGMPWAAFPAALFWAWGAWISSRRAVVAVLPLILFGSFLLAAHLWSSPAVTSPAGAPLGHFSGPVRLTACLALFSAAMTLCAPFRPRWSDMIAAETSAS